MFNEMSGHEFEQACAKKLKKNGFSNISVTKGSGDQGIDVIAYKNGKKYGIQCKYYSSPVGNWAVQEAFAGAKFYDCDIAVVMTNTTFTKSAYELAQKTGVQLWENNHIHQSSNTSKMGCFGYLIIFLLFCVIVSSVPDAMGTMFIILIPIVLITLFIIGKRQQKKNAKVLEDINQKIDSTILDMGNIYLNFFKDHFYINAELVRYSIISEKKYEFIYRLESHEQAQYIMSKEAEFNVNMNDMHTITLLADNHISFLVEQIKNDLA